MTAGSPWKTILARRLPELGHRNWIGVVDSAYPLQTSPGIELIRTDAGYFEVLDEVLKTVALAPHVRPLVHLDAELAGLTEALAPAAPAFRRQLEAALERKETVLLPHEDIIAKLDAAGAMFRILLFKTTLTLPYTSVFLQLECGYWSAEAEKSLRSV